jgi:tRNA nucleotidyltransferase (CCA-adding enzyme)
VSHPTKLIFAPVQEAFIRLIAQHAQALSLSAFLVGGIVRDALLQRHNQDMDFVIEGDAIGFARHLAQHYGGKVSVFTPFGTAKWHLDSDCATRMGIAEAELPQRVDFAMARRETYPQPAVLPVVQPSTIHDDLRRRDFSINALAYQISPMAQFGKILDAFNGINDLHDRQVRVLHDMSFQDDPTRLLRAVRFVVRFGFVLDRHTQALFQRDLTFLERVTGERIRNEFDAFWREATPEAHLRTIHEWGIAHALDNAWMPSPHFEHFCQNLRLPYPAWSDEKMSLYWHGLLAHLPPQDIIRLGNRLLMPTPHIRALQHSAQLLQDNIWQVIDTPISAIVARLEGVPAISRLAVWLLSDMPTRQRLEQYQNEWQTIRPITDGNTLLQMGLLPSPHFARILTALRQAWLDKIIHNEAQEKALLMDLLKAIRRDDPPTQ